MVLQGHPGVSCVCCRLCRLFLQSLLGGRLVRGTQAVLSERGLGEGALTFACRHCCAWSSGLAARLLWAAFRIWGGRAKAQRVPARARSPRARRESTTAQWMHPSCLPQSVGRSSEGQRRVPLRRPLGSTPACGWQLWCCSCSARPGLKPVICPRNWAHHLAAVRDCPTRKWVRGGLLSCPTYACGHGWWLFSEGYRGPYIQHSPRCRGDTHLPTFCPVHPPHPPNAGAAGDSRHVWQPGACSERRRALRAGSERRRALRAGSAPAAGPPRPPPPLNASLRTARTQNGQSVLVQQGVLY